jgi:hypothetical protein
MKLSTIEYHGTRSKKKDRDRTSELAKGKTLAHYIVVHCNVGVTED